MREPLSGPSAKMFRKHDGGQSDIFGPQARLAKKNWENFAGKLQVNRFDMCQPQLVPPRSDFFLSSSS